MQLNKIANEIKAALRNFESYYITYMKDSEKCRSRIFKAKYSKKKNEIEFTLLCHNKEKLVFNEDNISDIISIDDGAYSSLTIN